MYWTKLPKYDSLNECIDTSNIQSLHEEISYADLMYRFSLFESAIYDSANNIYTKYNEYQIGVINEAALSEHMNNAKQKIIEMWERLVESIKAYAAYIHTTIINKFIASNEKWINENKKYLISSEPIKVEIYERIEDFKIPAFDNIIWKASMELGDSLLKNGSLEDIDKSIQIAFDDIGISYGGDLVGKIINGYLGRKKIIDVHPDKLINVFDSSKENIEKLVSLMNKIISSPKIARNISYKDYLSGNFNEATLSKYVSGMRELIQLTNTLVKANFDVNKKCIAVLKTVASKNKKEA